MPDPEKNEPDWHRITPGGGVTWERRRWVVLSVTDAEDGVRTIELVSSGLRRTVTTDVVAPVPPTADPMPDAEDDATVPRKCARCGHDITDYASGLTLCAICDDSDSDDTAIPPAGAVDA